MIRLYLYQPGSGRLGLVVERIQDRVYRSILPGKYRRTITVNRWVLFTMKMPYRVQRCIIDLWLSKPNQIFRKFRRHVNLIRRIRNHLYLKSIRFERIGVS